MKNRLLLLLLVPVWLVAQSGVDITGRASLNTVNYDYDTKSDIKPDSVAEDQYSKTTLVPGLRQSLNLSLFARTQNVDISLIGDIRNNKWNKIDFNDQHTLDRLSLSIRYGRHEIVAGDFYESGSEYFLQSREIRGGKVNLVFENIWTKNDFINFKTIYGLSEKKLAQGSRLKSLYHQYETSGVYNRTLFATTLGLGQRGVYKIGLNYLNAEDDKNSIESSLNDPLANQNIGVDAQLFLWKKRLQFFAEGFSSKKDSLNAGSSTDNSYKAGFDLRYSNFKFMAYYHHIGYNYYSAGYPFLLNNKKGAFLQSGYMLPKNFYIGIDAESYTDNLQDDKTLPVTDTRSADLTFTTMFTKLPEITIVMGYRDDLSNTLLNENSEKTKTDKITRKYELRISQNINIHRISLTNIFLDLDDNSAIVGGDPLGTEQFISSLNFYFRPTNQLFLSGGGVYSRLLLTDGKSNSNYFFYQSSRWDIIPQKLIFESTLNYSLNSAKNGGNDDLLNKYNQLDGQLSIEYFLSQNLSFKAIGGTNLRNMDYSTTEALQLLQNPDIDPTFFNGNESYKALIYGAEINWMF